MALTETRLLPRVTYSNIGEDFTPVHDHLDRLIPRVKAELLGGFQANLIGGREDRDGERYVAPSPIDRDLILGEFVAASADAVDRAVEAAQAASPDWRSRSWQERVTLLCQAAEEIDRRKYEVSVACLL